jgi:hypothetical protein
VTAYGNSAAATDPQGKTSDPFDYRRLGSATRRIS